MMKIFLKFHASDIDEFTAEIDAPVPRVGDQVKVYHKPYVVAQVVFDYDIGEVRVLLELVT